MTAIGSMMHLYRSILKLHKSKLPAPLREMGDKYVKTEFAAHIKGNATEKQWHQFMAEWDRYRRAMCGHADAEVQPDVLGLMNSEQQVKMVELYKEAQNLRKSIIKGSSP
jgi:hypothetical protein